MGVVEEFETLGVLECGRECNENKDAMYLIISLDISHIILS